MKSTMYLAADAELHLLDAEIENLLDLVNDPDATEFQKTAACLRLRVMAGGRKLLEHILLTELVNSDINEVLRAINAA